MGPHYVWVGIVLSTMAAFALTGALFPRDRVFVDEVNGWSLVLGPAIVAVGESALLAFGLRPSPAIVLGSFVALALAGAAFHARWWRLSRRNDVPAPWRVREIALCAVVVAGVLLYALRALAEPMWSNDFLAIWGLKGKAFALSIDGRFPGWLRDPEIAGFSHPEYPLGLPLLFAGLARIGGGWDDQALALVYPILQAGTLYVLFGWLRRRGATRGLALAAAALVALFEPLYSAFLTGMAEVPLSLAILLVAISLSDALDGTDPRAVRRLAAASFLAASVKNEGLFIAVAATGLALLSKGERRGRILVAAAALVPAVGLTVLSRVLHGPVPLRDFDFGFLAPARWGELASRLSLALREDARLAAGAIPVLAAIAILFACGRSGPAARWADRPLILGLVALAAYLTLPAFAVMGPVWLAQTTLFRTAAALVPLAAAGLAGRLASVYAAPEPASPSSR